MSMTRIAGLAAVALALGIGSAGAEVLDTIRQRGTLIVGSKADYKPFGFRDPSGAIVGIEPDLAADLAKRLGVKVELVPVVSANRIEFLNQGKIDVVIATMSDTPERRKVVQAIDPPYYSDFVNVLVAKKANVASWEDLKGKPVCGTTGAWYNRDVARRYGVEVVAFDGSEKPLFALKQGNCVGYLYDQTFIQGKLLDDDWKGDYAMPLSGIMEAPWMVAVAPNNPQLKAALEDVQKAWFKEGTVVALERKYGIQPTEYSLKMSGQAKPASTN